MNFGVVKEITEYAKEEAKKHGKKFQIYCNNKTVYC